MPKKKKKQSPNLITNRRARFDYELGDDLVVGLQLLGTEVKSLRMGHGQLRGAYVIVRDNELWLLNATINGTAGVPIDEMTQTRTRKLLAKRKQIDQLISAKQQGNSIIPTAILTQGKYIKLRIAVGKGKKKYDKRETIKRRDQDKYNSREIAKLSRN